MTVRALWGVLGWGLLVGFRSNALVVFPVPGQARQRMSALAHTNSFS